MKKYLQGKKLLVLGATSGEISLVKRAQEFGIYVIVTDSHKDWTLSPAKQYADEAWNISWSDISALKEKCIQEKVDGATAGYSEIRVDSLIRLCEEMKFPCYITMEQLDITRDKIKFKDECRKNGVPVVKEYPSVESVDEFPVIVKPTDRAGSIGISIASNEQELKRSYEYAMEMSLTNSVIIEKFIEDQSKIDIYYAVEDGVITPITTTDVINAADNGRERVVQSSWLYPCKYQKELLEKEDQNLRRMIQGMGIKYGCIFFSGFVDKEKKEFVFFECGFRLEGGHQYEYVSRKGPMNFLDLFICHALTGKTEIIKKKKDINSNLKCGTINFYSKKGTIASISGVDTIAKMDSCSLALVSARVGQECNDDKAILSKLAMFSFCDESGERIAEDMETAYSLFKVAGTNGEDLIYDRIDTFVVKDWWN